MIRQLVSEDGVKLRICMHEDVHMHTLALRWRAARVAKLLCSLPHAIGRNQCVEK
jgi:hypothetical protein